MQAISMDYDKKMDYPSNGDDNTSTSSKHDEKDLSSSLYRLEIVGIELLSLYGTEFSISLQDFQDAEPDILVHSTSAIIEQGLSSGIALKALCKKKGLHAGEANLISVDSVGMDVRVFAGAQVQTHRFPFKTRATTEMAAEKNIHQLLFPPSRRRKLKSNDKSLKDAYRSKKHYQNHQTKKQRRSYFATGTVCGVYTSSFLLRLCT
ncbi:unnamed protein product [Brassica oleracea var. botrytis]|uniref:DUF2470 domain-containing protein n=1 Tax=Brassica oleracea TaxID=3712 RepID=A0A3P6H8K6_BRAOL|nr:unnamed protein product [Brassica oleracea]